MAANPNEWLEFMISASLWINILVLAPICIGLILNKDSLNAVFGYKTTARQILLCMYLTILAASISLLALKLEPRAFVQALLAMQIAYKLLSVVLISDKKTPVLWFNLVIAIFHSTTLFLMDSGS
jgi:hypothetical protein